MPEWKSPLNPFNSMKVLTHAYCFEQIINGEIPAPVSVTVDSTNTCDLRCEWCHSYAFRKENMRTVSEEDLLWVADALPELGAKSCCFAGGGEGFLHPSSGNFLCHLKDNGLKVGTITNGTHIDSFMDDILYSCRWIGVSVDAATPETYKKLKRGDTSVFFHVINNIKTLARKRVNNYSPSIGFKFLLHPESYHELLDAVRLAKSIGANDFHARPCYGPGIHWEWVIVDEALELVKLAQGMLETDDFHVYGVTHKFDETFQKKIVDKCEVTPIAGLTFAADGYCYVCCDLRSEPMGQLCKWRDIFEVWGSEKHREILNNINPACCPVRCTYSPYQEILERVFRNDEMTYEFP